MPKVSNQVYMCDPKIWKLFRTQENGEKEQNAISSFTQHLISFIIAIYVSFYDNSTNGVGFVDGAFADISWFTFYSVYTKKLLYRSAGAHIATSYLGHHCWLYVLQSLKKGFLGSSAQILRAHRYYNV